MKITTHCGVYLSVALLCSGLFCGQQHDLLHADGVQTARVVSATAAARGSAIQLIKRFFDPKLDPAVRLDDVKPSGPGVQADERMSLQAILCAFSKFDAAFDELASKHAPLAKDIVARIRRSNENGILPEELQKHFKSLSDDTLTRMINEECVVEYFENFVSSKPKGLLPWPQFVDLVVKRLEGNNSPEICEFKECIVTLKDSYRPTIGWYLKKYVPLLPKRRVQDPANDLSVKELGKRVFWNQKDNPYPAPLAAA